MEVFREAVPEDSRREAGGAAVPAGSSRKTAERKRLEQAFCRKIGKELAGFKKKVLRINKEEIYALAYRIDYMIRIYEILAERSTEMEDRELACCLREKKLLWSLYLGWLKAPAPGEEELEYSLSSGIEEICRKAGIGGSDAGAVCGLNPYRTAMQVYPDKTTDSLKSVDSEAMRQGKGALCPEGAGRDDRGDL